MEQQQIPGRVQVGCMDGNPTYLKYLRHNRLKLVWMHIMCNHLVRLVPCLHKVHSQLEPNGKTIATSIRIQALLEQEHLAL